MKENILININEKIKNMHIFVWKCLLGFLILIPFIMVGGYFISRSEQYQALAFIAGSSNYDRTNEFIGGFIIFLGFLFVLVNWIQGIIALYKSTKDIDDMKNCKTYEKGNKYGKLHKK